MTTFVAILPSANAAEQWIKLTTPHFELYTTVGEKAGRNAILHFEEVRNFFLLANPEQKAPNFPVRIIIFKNEKQYLPYRISETAFAYYSPGLNWDTIVMQDAEQEHYPVAIHEYVHLLTRHMDLKLPVWLNEGVADLYSSLQPYGKQALVGALIPGRVYTIRQQKMMPLAALFAVDHKSPEYNEKNKAGIFYAESWALTHMLAMAPEYHAKFPQFTARVVRGTAADTALQETYGRPVAEVEKDLKGYLSRSSLSGSLFNIKLTKSEEEATAEVVSEADAELVLAQLLLSINRRDEAKTRLTKLAADRPNHPQVEESLGFLALRANNDDEAREHFAKAVTGKTENAQVYYWHAILEQRAGASADKYLPLLQKAAELRPDDDDIRLTLADFAMVARKYQVAYRTLLSFQHVKEEHAFRVFYGLSYCVMNLGNPDEAKKAAKRAQGYAKGEDEIRRLNNLTSYLNRDQQAAVALDEAGAPKLVRQPQRVSTEGSLTQPPLTPEEQPLKVSGMTSRVECLAGKAKIHVLVNGKPMVFLIADPDKIQIRGTASDTREFVCGPQKPEKVTVEYWPNLEVQALIFN